jgi:hypothetical protein
MLRIYRYIKNLFVRKQANVKVVSPKEHEQKPYKHVTKVEKNESQDILIHRPVTNKFVQDRIRSNNVYNHSVRSIITQNEINSTTNNEDLLLPINPSTQFENFMNHDDDYSRTPSHDVDYSRHNNHNYTPSHSDNNHTHSHHDYTPSHDSGSSYQSDSTSYDSGSSGSSDW